MSNAHIEGSGPYFKVAVHHAEDEAGDDDKGRGPSDRHHPIGNTDIAPGFVKVPAYYHS